VEAGVDGLASELLLSDEDDGVVVLIINRPPHNYFDEQLIAEIASVVLLLAAEGACRAIVLASEGRSFCAGADLSSPIKRSVPPRPLGLYDWALDILTVDLPIVAAVQGAAVGGGMGLALAADLRVGTPSTRFIANFAKLGFNHGFAMTETLPAAVGPQVARDLLLTGRAVLGEEALSLGLIDRLVPEDQVMAEAILLAREIGANAPLAVRSIRSLLGADRASLLRRAIEREGSEQRRLRKTEDFREGVKASSERRAPQFKGA
jgi:2-(1,2-epoxy-1,2-dihydrophenyl)acetyl-CoA isomerase